MATNRKTFTLDGSLVEQARRLGSDISAAARRGVTAAIRDAQVESDQAAYERRPEEVDSFWADAEAWGEE